MKTPHFSSSDRFQSAIAACLLATLSYSVEGFGGTFNQDEVCRGQDGLVVRSDANAGADPDGWFVYSGSLIICCEGHAYDVMCSEMMAGYCDCPTTVPKDASDYETSIACYGRQCTSEVYATPIEFGDPVDQGPTAMCWLPEDMTRKAQGFTNNVTVSGKDFCRAYHSLNKPVPPPKELHPEEKGQFELIKNKETGTSSTGIVPVHAVMIPRTGRVVMWTRGQQPNAPIEPDTEFAVSAVYDWTTGEYFPVDVDSNPFCSGVGFSKNGNVLAFGGEQNTAPWGEQWQPTQTIEGRNMVREFDVETYTWRNVAQLPGNHWYPTQTLLEDGRVLNQGGFSAMVGPQNEMFEIFDSNTNEVVTWYESTPFAETMGIMNLYPFFSYVPYTNPEKPDDIYLLMDLCNHSEMYTITKDNNLTQRAVLPQMAEGRDICAAFSAVGFSRFLPFKPPYDKPEYFSAGGIVNSTADILDGNCWSDIKGSDKSFRISVSPEDILNNNSKWEEETMPFPRVGGLSVTLPNGELLIMNGAKKGSGNDYLRDAVRTAVMYDPGAPAGERYRTLATSPIKRLYHNVAMLLPTGNVLVAGGEQGEAYTQENGGPWCGTNYDYTYEAEEFKPPYVFTPELRPTIIKVEGGEEHEFGKTIRVYYKGPKIDGATITSPAAVTHGLEMNSRTAFLEVASVSQARDGVEEQKTSWLGLRGGSSEQSSSSGHNDNDNSDNEEQLSYADLVLPKQSHRVTTSGWHMLFLLNGKAPSHEAVWIKLLDNE